MAVSLTSAGGDFLRLGSAVTSGVPLTMACWFNMDNITAAHALIWIGDGGSTNRYITLIAAGNVSGDPVRLFIHSHGAGTNIADSTTGYSGSTWHHAAGVVVSMTEAYAFIDGGSKGSDNGGSPNDPFAWDRTTIGYIDDSTPGSNADGDIAEAAIWDTNLSDAEIAWLATGASPLSLTHRLANLVMYKPLIAGTNNEFYNIGGTFTEQGTPSYVAHAPVMYPTAAQIFAPIAAAAAPSTFIPTMMIY